MKSVRFFRGQFWVPNSKSQVSHSSCNGVVVPARIELLRSITVVANVYLHASFRPTAKLRRQHSYWTISFGTLSAKRGWDVPCASREAQGDPQSVFAFLDFRLSVLSKIYFSNIII